ncbi:hypothetical protein RJF_1141 [Candidozyma auris]
MVSKQQGKAYEAPTAHTINIEGSVVLSILRHTSENFPSLFSGSLMGFEDDEGTIDITHAYPFPYPDQYEGGSFRSKSGSKYQQEILEALKSLDEGVEFQGWFQSTVSGNFVTSSLVDAVAQQQLNNKNSFLLVHNMVSVGKGLDLKALRLSENFLTTYLDGKWKTKDLETHKLSYLNIFDETPIHVHNQHLVNLYLASSKETTLPNEFDTLNFSSNSNITTQLLENLYSQIDSFNFDQTNFNYYQRLLQKEHTKILQWKQNRKNENTERVKIGEPELDPNEWQNIFKLPTGPSRFNNTLYSRAIDELADDILKKCDQELIKSHEQARRAGLVLREFLEQFGEKDGVNARSVLFYTSPYLRARQTCHDIIEGIKDLEGVQYQVKEEARMREQDFGNFQSTPEEMEKIWAQRAHYGHFFFRIPHGESAADVYDRIASFNETLFRQFHQDKFPNVLVLVTHGIWARVFLMKWFRWSYEDFESLRNIPHCHFLIMKQQKTGRYLLKTPLKTWDDLRDSDVEEEISKEFTQEVNFNSMNKLDNPDDMDIHSIIRAQVEAIEENRHKDRQIRENYKNTLVNKLSQADQSLQNSTEDVSNVGN